MRRPSFMTVSPEELEKVSQFLKAALYYDKKSRKFKGHRRRHRAQIVYFSLLGKTVSWIAHEFNVSEQTVWKWRRIYKQQGIEGLKGKHN